MLNENIALEVDGISKTYRSYSDELGSNSGKVAQEIFSLKNISFQLAKGEILGVIGNNGTGKSTLLKILSGLIKPDAGRVTYQGKLSSILDIGSGFHPDLTGIDNVYMVGRLIGYSNAEIKLLLPQIIEFSELHQFMQTQVKHYSNGMFMRLAFSVYTTLKSDILILDEVLSVGDINFREKSSARIKEIAASGTTIILASHELKTIQRLCTHGMLIEKGIKKGFDTIQNIVDQYVVHDLVTSYKRMPNAQADFKHQNIQQDTNLPHAFPSVKSDHKMVLHSASVQAAGKQNDASVYMDDIIEITCDYEKLMIGPVILSAVIADKLGNNLMSLCSYRMSDTSKFVDTNPVGRYRQSVKLPRGLLNQGMFSISFYFTSPMHENLLTFEKLLYFKVHKSDFRFHALESIGNYKHPLFPISDWQTVTVT